MLLVSRSAMHLIGKCYWFSEAQFIKHSKSLNSHRTLSWIYELQTSIYVEHLIFMDLHVYYYLILSFLVFVLFPIYLITLKLPFCPLSSYAFMALGQDSYCTFDCFFSVIFVWTFTLSLLSIWSHCFSILKTPGYPCNIWNKLSNLKSVMLKLYTFWKQLWFLHSPLSHLLATTIIPSASQFKFSYASCKWDHSFCLSGPGLFYLEYNK